VADYGRTRLSVSAVVQMDYPVTSGFLSGADLDHLLDVIGGENRLFSWLSTEGYNTTYVESGWYGTKCGSEIDRCVEAPWPDESFYDVTYRSLFRDLPGFETGLSFARGAQHVMTWLTRDLPSILEDSERDVIYAHVLAPHPPLFMDDNCEIDARAGFKGFTIYQPGMTTSDLEEARKAYANQVRCVNEMLLQVAETADATDSMVVMFGDHGPDSLGQLFIPGADWDEAQRFERLSSFLATRVPACDMSSPRALVNVGRRLMSCISTNELADLPVRAFEGRPGSGGEEIVEVPSPSFGGGT
jgi:hypothetical protein